MPRRETDIEAASFEAAPVHNVQNEARRLSYEQRRRSHDVVRTNLAQALNLGMSRRRRCWVFLLLSLIVIGIYLATWTENTFEQHAKDFSNTPLALMMRPLYIIALLNCFQSEIIGCFCTRDADSHGSEEPTNIMAFKNLTRTVTVLWPVVGGMLLLHTNKVDANLVAAMRILLFYYVALFTVAVLLPAVSITLMVRLIRRGWVRFPQRPPVAPEKLLDQLQPVAYVPALFVDNKDGCYPAACAICLESFSSDRAIVRTNCSPSRGHAFHKDCLRGWLEVSGTCPLCRIDL